VAYEHSDGSAAASTTIVVSGGFGVGKTTFVAAVSETMPLRTEALVKNAAPDMDGAEDTPARNATTVEVDFGRITLDESDVVLYLFGTPGPRRLWFVWDDLIRSAIGAIVLADGRRLRESLAAAAFFEARNLPFLIAVNQFDDAPRHPTHVVRTELALPDHIPVVSVDARNRESAMATVIAVMEYSLSTLTPLRG
jgi:uncharacterized protein